ncbi:MAG: PilT/PilU family type 4a pilus ATPase [Lentisphaerae bacterium]|nr:PilT/PilU family type 4a pilus ATPase [Lentisphaerota bacterium]
MFSFQQLLRYAVEAKASDIHLVANRPPCFRQQGELVELDNKDLVLSTERLGEIVEAMVPAHLRDTYATECEVDFSFEEPGVGRFRVNVFREKGLPSMALRLVKQNVPGFDELGLPKVLGDLALSRSGIVLASGASGSGKSTTLAAMIEWINDQDSRRIITIEDPIEFLFTNRRSIILQREINVDTRSFQAALRNTLRQDPDVVMIGEMRDAESFAAALSMAETGHLVLSTLHADPAPQAITRILNFFPTDERDVIRMGLARNLRAVIGQRLLPGVDGRLVPAVELMINTPLVSKLLATNVLEKLSAAISSDPESGMCSFDDSIQVLIESDRLSVEAGLAGATNPESLRMRLSGINLTEGHRIMD